jgi:hypothetical protein
MAGNGVIALRFGFRVAQAFGEQFAGALNGMLLFRDMVAAVVEQARQRLAGGLPVHTVLHAVRQPGDQRGAFDQTLGVDDRVIFCACTASRKAWRSALIGAENQALRQRRIATGSPGRPLHARTGSARTLFNHPVKANAGKGLHGVGQRGQRMQHVAHGRGFYDQYPHPLRFLFSVFPQQRV